MLTETPDIGADPCPTVMPVWHDVDVRVQPWRQLQDLVQRCPGFLDVRIRCNGSWCGAQFFVDERAEEPRVDCAPSALGLLRPAFAGNVEHSLKSGLGDSQIWVTSTFNRTADPQAIASAWFDFVASLEEP